ncbi:MAG: hypothetical protein IVW55_02330 [Chloroflexi bacterium]|nr:hypothetical protein [Chloroflexota bacterium]
MQVNSDACTCAQAADDQSVGKLNTALLALSVVSVIIGGFLATLSR